MVALDRLQSGALQQPGVVVSRLFVSTLLLVAVLVFGAAPRQAAENASTSLNVSFRGQTSLRRAALRCSGQTTAEGR